MQGKRWRNVPEIANSVPNLFPFLDYEPAAAWGAAEDWDDLVFWR